MGALIIIMEITWLCLHWIVTIRVYFALFQTQKKVRCTILCSFAMISHLKSSSVPACTTWTKPGRRWGQQPQISKRYCYSVVKWTHVTFYIAFGLKFHSIWYNFESFFDLGKIFWELFGGRVVGKLCNTKSKNLWALFIESLFLLLSWAAHVVPSVIYM